MKYVVVGLVGLTIDFSAFFLLSDLAVPVQIANALSIAAASIVTFVLHAKFTFNGKITFSNFVGYFLVVLVGLAVGASVLHVMVAHEQTLLAAKILSTISAISVQFALSIGVVFRRGGSPPTSAKFPSPHRGLGRRRV